MSQFTLSLVPERHVWKVSELTLRIKDVLEAEFDALWVEGEVSNYREAQSGHLYFTLKDAKAQVRCVCFRDRARLLKFRPEDGLHVTVRGGISVYEPRGEYQIYVTQIEPVGLGALQLAFEQLKAKLEAEGLFDEARKKPLPVLPRRIGLVTSPAGAAVRDVLRVLRRRFPNLHVLIYPVKVQGDGAPGEIIEGLRYFNRAKAADVLILARGGGSLEDLWAFNEEGVARAIAASRIPVISGVGHETDFTIADFVADVRAPTPSAAAEIVVGTRQEFLKHIAELRRRAADRMRLVLHEQRGRLHALETHRGFRRPEDLLRRRRLRLDELAAGLEEHLRAQLKRSRDRYAKVQQRLASLDLRSRVARRRLRVEQRVAELRTRIERQLVVKRRRLEAGMLKLHERSPLAVLERGYAICYDAKGNIVRAAVQVGIGDEIGVRLGRGRLGATVKSRTETGR